MIELPISPALLERALKHYTPLHQQDKFVEESGELNTAIMQHRDGRVGTDAVVTEIADVLVTALQLAKYYGWDDTMSEIERKTARLRQRMDSKE